MTGTLVMINDGYKSIEKIKKGDWVWAYDVKLNKQVKKRVTAIHPTKYCHL